MKKVFLLLVAVVCISFVNAQQKSATIKLAPNAITADGVLDELEWLAWDNEIHTIIGGVDNYTGETVTDAADLSAYWQACYDVANIYVAVAVTADDVLQTDPLAGFGADWQQDLVEVYFDTNVGNLADGGSPSTVGTIVGPNGKENNDGTTGHYQLSSRREVGAYTADRAWKTSVVHGFTLNGTTSIDEYSVPWATITDNAGGVIDGTAAFGFDVYVADNDADGLGRNRCVWSDNSSVVVAEAWSNMDQCGNLTGTGVDLNVGTKKVAAEKSFSVSPVPAKNNVNILSASKINTCDVINMSGQVVLSSKNLNTKSANINVSSLKRGAYVVRINGSLNKMITVE